MPEQKRPAHSDCNRRYHHHYPQRPSSAWALRLKSQRSRPVKLWNEWRVLICASMRRPGLCRLARPRLRPGDI